MSIISTHFDVSRETQDALDHLEVLVRKWNPRINLVAKSTLAALQDRHFADGIALIRYGEGVGKWVDLGSGGGFPGLVVAIIEGGKRPIKLIESDGRKCAFLATARRELGLSVEIVNSRIEAADPQRAEVISARALAPLPGLLEFSARHVAEDGALLFLKGANWRSEDLVARKNWEYDLEVFDNPAGTGSVILKIKNARRIKQ
ncbi:16S rRNA (guanine527-N7)-methyltransferase [Jannaschia faecimaris]|uniref:Ribosomal RNA small subunit methyltransferase G n=1 Tax=Jannaschia faecimaris TaxID=1244108 RepID=A0A1H3JGJ8_9RHOB|nr:16S rRNA (guanine(527)-N(7))-methyltransferase RsmG [Jannaschia faecimaris]SDY39041.1 16S rRNA (guanine527-N7)-methyltransferase [Jannaschia faecimaris]